MFPSDTHLELRLVSDRPHPAPTFIKAIVISIFVGLSVSLALQLLNSFESETSFDSSQRTSYDDHHRNFTSRLESDPRNNFFDNQGGGSDSIIPPPILEQRKAPDEQLPAFDFFPKAIAFAPLENQPRVRISQCNGSFAPGANMRSFPDRSVSNIKGVIPAGHWVTLTGATAYGDSLVWYEVINESELAFSTQENAYNQIESNQKGWIAACFVE